MDPRVLQETACCEPQIKGHTDPTDLTDILNRRVRRAYENVSLWLGCRDANFPHEQAHREIVMHCILSLNETYTFSS